ncbi:hypothetical protein NDU88_003384 [Pleurodeles waltl]|uniref:Uncharacterized protein n=1 Tax=Pleurodeles waltl TaxID=8319 RepID=A0AAV7TNF1_PLEWA|nr:hypothetical protein NDU88_003384 [Pleurodeles waltl]
MCAPRFLEIEADWRAAGDVWWRRAALELRRVRKGVARIPLRGNSGNGSRNSGSWGAAAEKTRQGAQFKETLVKEARRNTVRQCGWGGDPLSPPLFLTRVEGTDQWPRDNLVVTAEEKGGKRGSAKKKSKSKSGEGGRTVVRKVGESKLKGRDKLTPSLRSFFKVKPDVIKLTPGQDRVAMEVTTRQSDNADGEGRGWARPPRHRQERNRWPQYKL